MLDNWFGDALGDFVSATGKYQQRLSNYHYFREVAGVVKVITHAGKVRGLEMQLPELTIDLQSIQTGMVDARVHSGSLKSYLINDPQDVLEFLFGGNCPVLEMSPIKVRLRPDKKGDWLSRVETNRGDLIRWAPLRDIGEYQSHPAFDLFISEMKNN